MQLRHLMQTSLDYVNATLLPKFAPYFPARSRPPAWRSAPLTERSAPVERDRYLRKAPFGRLPLPGRAKAASADIQRVRRDLAVRRDADVVGADERSVVPGLDERVEVRDHALAPDDRATVDVGVA